MTNTKDKTMTRGAVLLLGLLAFTLAGLLAPEAARAWPTKFSSCTGCHTLADADATIAMAVDGAAGTSVTVPAGTTFELDFIIRNAASAGAIGIEAVVPSGWTVAAGTANTPALAGWKAVWNAAAAGAWEGNSKAPVTNPYAVAIAGFPTAVDGRTINFAGTGWDSGTRDAAFDNGGAGDLDGVANEMGGDLRVTVPGGTANGSYTVLVHGIGHHGGTKSYFRQTVTVTVGAGGDSTPPVPGTVTVTPQSGSFVPAAFAVSTSFTDAESAVTACDYTLNGGGAWSAGTVSGTGPYTCTANVSGQADAAGLTINMRATSSGGTGTAIAIGRTVDAAGPTDGALTVIPGNTQNDLSWTAASDAGSGLRATSTYDLRFVTGGTPPADCAAGTSVFTGTATSYAHTGLTNGTTYSYRVCAYDNFDQSSAGATGSGTPTAGNAAPAAPANPSQYQADGSTPIAVGGYATGTTVVFAADLSDPDGDTVKLQIDTTGDSAFDCESALVASGSTGVQVTCPGLTDGAGYDWQYRAVDSNAAASAWSAFNAASPDFTVDVSPPADGTLSITPGDTQLVLTWTAASDAASGLASPAYTVVMATGTATPPADCSGAPIYTGDALTHTETGLVNGTDYAFRVCATDNVGLSSAGATASAQPSAAPNSPPTVTGSLAQYEDDGATPLAPAGNAASNAVVIEAQISDVEGDLAVLEVDIDSDGAVDCVSAAVSGSGTPQALCGALADGAYDWQVRARDAFGNTSGWSAFAGSPDFNIAAGVDIGIDTTPPAESGLAAVPGDTVIDLSWNVADDGAGSGLDPVNTYKVVRATGAAPADCSGAGVYTGNFNAYSDTGLSNGTTYYYRVCAYDQVGNVSTGQTTSATPGSACTYNSPAVSILTADKTIAVDGGFVDYTIQVSNGDVGACPATAFDLVVVDSNGTAFYPTTLATDPLNVVAGGAAQTTIRVTARPDQDGASNTTYFYTTADGNHAQSANSNPVTTTITVSGGGCVADGDYLLSNGDRMTTSR